MTESQDLFQSELNEDDLIAQLLSEDHQNVAAAMELPVVATKQQTSPDKLHTEKLSRFPLARIKNLMKMDPDLNLTSSEAVFLIARASELFLKNLSKQTYVYTAKAKRKTVQKRDVDAAIENADSLCFLEGALE